MLYLRPSPAISWCQPKVNWFYVVAKVKTNIFSTKKFFMIIEITQQTFVGLEGVLKTSWRHVLKTSWRQTKCLLEISVSKKSKSGSDKSICHISISDKSTSSTPLQRNTFWSSKTSWRRLEDISQDVLKTSWKTKSCYAEDVFKTSWRHVFKISSRRLGNKKIGISV